MLESTESFIEAEAAGYTWERRAPRPGDDHMLGHTQNWLNALPKGVRPVHLPEDFPRIANDLGRLWAETPALDPYFEELEFSPRTDRTTSVTPSRSSSRDISLLIAEGVRFSARAADEKLPSSTTLTKTSISPPRLITR